MKCHYEILGVSKDVGDEELKKAYRKQALKCHPDKNIDNAEEAKEQFQLVQQAYEVLSDSHERAWYDAHREAILKGGLGSDYKDDSLDVFQFFTATCFKGYGDDENGFYAVYKEVFSKIAAEDLEYRTDEDSDFEIPGFGDSKSAYEEVVHPFYAYWQSYSTKKSYAWLDPYDTRDAPNRRVVRAAEKENKKIRDKARKQRNEEVRNLVAFVRKRDKRVQAYVKQLEERAAENARKAEERRKKVLRDRQEEMKGYKESEWAKFSNIEKELKQIEANLAQEFGDSEISSSGEEASREEEDYVATNCFYCVACNKVFKTEKAFANHENSKKHKENIEILKASVLDEEEELKNAEMFDNLCTKSTECNESLSESDISESTISETLKNKSKKKSKKQNRNTIQSSLYDTSDDELESEIGQSRKQRRKQRHVLREHKKASTSNSEIKSGNQTAEVIEAQGPSINLNATEDHSEKASDLDTKQQKDNKQEAPIPINSKEQQVKGAGSSQKLKKCKEGKKKVNAESVQDLNHHCVTCHSEFPSKNKLFDHLKKTGHSVHIPRGTGPSARGLVEEKKKGKSKKSK